MRANFPSTFNSYNRNLLKKKKKWIYSWLNLWWRHFGSFPAQALCQGVKCVRSALEISSEASLLPAHFRRLCITLSWWERAGPLCLGSETNIEMTSEKSEYFGSSACFIHCLIFKSKNGNIVYILFCSLVLVLNSIADCPPVLAHRSFKSFFFFQS